MSRICIEKGVIIDSRSAEDLLAKISPDGKKNPLKIGDVLEINGHRAFIAGIAKTTPGFFPQPIMFMLNDQVYKFSGNNRIQYIAAKTRKDADIEQVIQSNKS